MLAREVTDAAWLREETTRRGAEARRKWNTVERRRRKRTTTGWMNQIREKGKDKRDVTRRTRETR
jgi:hypothetical protein